MIYGGGVFLFLFAITAPFIFVTNYKTPTCFDGKQNQNETSIDRGGPCVLLDSRSIKPITTLWSRSFPVRKGFYDAVAYIENPNENAGVYSATYQFKLYDNKNILIAERFGTTPIFPGKVFPIFESKIDTGNRIPARAFFNFVTDFTWARIKDPTYGIKIINEKTSELNTSPRVDAVMRNDNLTVRENIIVVATLFDNAGNAIASSRTLVKKINSDEEIPIAFTWPQAFSSEVAKVDIVTLALPKRIK